MASDREKDILEDEEIIDLTDIIEEGLEVDSLEDREQAFGDSARDTELEEDLNGLFDSLDSEKDSRTAQGDELEEMFRDETRENSKSGYSEDQQDDDILKDFLGEEPQDEMLSDQDSSDRIQASEEADFQELEEAQTHPEDSSQGEVPGSEGEGQTDAIAMLAEQLESLSDRLDAFEERIINMENSFFEKTIETIEEKGPELGFLNRMLQEFKEDISAAIENRLDSLEPARQEPSEEDFRTSVLQVIEEKGLELSFVREFADKITDEIRSSILVEIDEKLGAIDQPQELTPQDIKDKALEAVEEKGLELSFIREFADKITDEIRSSILVEIDEKLGAIDQPQELTPQDIKDKALEAVEEKGLELSFVREFADKITDEVRSSILVEIDEKLGALDQPQELTPQDIKDKAIEAVEEKGLELRFIKEFADKITDNIRSSILVEIDEKLGAIDQPQELTPQDIKDKAMEAFAEKGLEMNLVSDLKEKITQETEELIYEKFSEIVQTIEPGEGSELSQKIQELERKIAEISTPDPDELKQDLMTEFEKLFQDKLFSFTEPPDPEEFKEEMNDLAEDRINSFIESWKNEKNSQATELENAFKLLGAMEERISSLSGEIGEVREKTGDLDLELAKKFESIYEQIPAGEDIANQVSQLKAELEEYILKKIPEAAARIIREEILAMVSEKK
jgi:hypothetical protein